jgi:hypothetical protein
MPATAAISYAIQLLGMMPGLIAAGQSVMGLVTQGQTALSKMQAEKRDPSPEEWAALDQMRDALHAQVQA